MAACFFAEMSYVNPPASGVLKGMFVPKLSGSGAVGDAIALLGALIMPYSFSSLIMPITFSFWSFRLNMITFFFLNLKFLIWES